MDSETAESLMNLRHLFSSRSPPPHPQNMLSLKRRAENSCFSNRRLHNWVTMGKTPKTNLQNSLGSDHTSPLGRVTTRPSRAILGFFLHSLTQETHYNYLFGWETLSGRHFSITSRVLHLGDRVPLDEKVIKETRLHFNFNRRNFPS